LLLLNRLKTILKKTLLSQAKITTTVSAAGCVIPLAIVFIISFSQISRESFILENKLFCSTLLLRNEEK
jgi:hypothetical protein